ncbi:MAG: LysR family transcriptional regulator [Myxococcota bacterium]
MGFLERLSLFRWVTELGSVTAAAQRAGWSLSKASRALDALEQELGCTLFVRSSRGTRLTPAGQNLLREAVVCLEAADRARAAVSSDGAPQGSLSISASVSWGLERLFPVLADLRERAPGLRVTLRLEDHPADLVTEGIDLAIRGGIEPPDSTSYMARLIEQLPCVVVGSPRLFEDGRAIPRQPDQLHGLPAVLSSEHNTSSRWLLHRGDERQEVVLSGVFFSRTLLARKRAAVHGMGITIVPRFACTKELSSGSLVELTPGWTIPDARIYAVYRSERRADPAIVAVLAALDAHASRGT